MHKFRELSINFVESKNKTIEILMSHLGNEWQRNLASEENLLAISGTAQVCLDYVGPNVPKSKVWLSKNGKQFYVANIIPQTKPQLSIEEYNQIIELFVNQVLSQSNLEYTVSKAEVKLQDLLSEESCRNFWAFSRTANKSTGRTHPNDEKKWLDFIYATLRHGEHLAAEDLRIFLQEEGWDEQTAWELSVDYQYGYEAMNHARVVA